MTNSQQAFLALLRAGLWEQSVHILQYSPVEFQSVYELAEEQSVVGLVAAGLEHVEDLKITKLQALPFLKKVYSLEQRNQLMNRFIASLFTQLNDVGIYSLLVKGQGLAQCYERPLWRLAGDIDLLLDEDNYLKAKQFLTPRASSIDKEYGDRLHLGLKIDSWVVELHGSLRSNRLGSINSCIDSTQDDLFKNGKVRVWRNGDKDIFLPPPDNDIIFVFAHILQHFYAGGIGLRQVCDWCRLLWSYQDEINRNLLKKRLDSAHLHREWLTFASLAVNYLGLPKEAMPFYRKTSFQDRKAFLLMKHILLTGRLRYNRDNSYYSKYPLLVYKAISFSRHLRNFFLNFRIFPGKSLIVFYREFCDGIKAMSANR